MFCSVRPLWSRAPASRPRYTTGDVAIPVPGCEQPKWRETSPPSTVLLNFAEPVLRCKTCLHTRSYLLRVTSGQSRACVAQTPRQQQMPVSPGRESEVKELLRQHDGKHAFVMHLELFPTLPHSNSKVDCLSLAFYVIN